MIASGMLAMEVCLAFSAAIPSAAPTTEKSPSIRYKETCSVKNNGDLELEYELTFSEPTYTQMRTSFAYPERLLRNFRIMDERQEFVKGKMQTDDARRRIVIKGTLLGALQNRNKGWTYIVKGADRYETVDAHPDSIMLFALTRLEDGTAVSGTTRLNFPHGTQRISFNGHRGEVTWEMPPPPSSNKYAEVAMDLRVHTETMSCLNRIYRDPTLSKLWIAKAVMRNKGPGTVRDFRIRFRLRQYTAWGEWKTRDTVYPTQTAIEVFYPAMNEQLCSLMDRTPILLEAIWSYRRPDGKVVEDYDGRILTIYGASQVVVGPEDLARPSFQEASSTAGPMNSFPATRLYTPVLIARDPLQVTPEPLPTLSPVPSFTPTVTPCPSPIQCQPPSPTPKPFPSSPPYRNQEGKQP